MTDHHLGLVVTTFKEFAGVYERRKAEALSAHMRKVAEIADRAQIVRICPQAPERPWVGLQEWEEGANGNRHGQWVSDLDVEMLR